MTHSLVCQICSKKRSTRLSESSAAARSGLRLLTGRVGRVCSYFFFTECQRQGLLHRAFGVEVPRLKRYLLMAADYSSNRRLWRTRYYMDTRYRDALTEETRRNLRQEDFDYSFLQVGAMFNVPSLVGNKAPCFSYHDGNMAQSLRSPYAVQGLSAKEIDRGLAYEKQVYRQLTRIFTMSEYLRQSFIMDFDVPPEKVLSVGAGINLERIPEYFRTRNTMGTTSSSSAWILRAKAAGNCSKLSGKFDRSFRTRYCTLLGHHD